MSPGNYVSNVNNIYCDGGEDRGDVDDVNIIAKNTSMYNYNPATGCHSINSITRNSNGNSNITNENADIKKLEYQYQQQQQLFSFLQRQLSFQQQQQWQQLQQPQSNPIPCSLSTPSCRPSCQSLLDTYRIQKQSKEGEALLHKYVASSSLKSSLSLPSVTTPYMHNIININKMQVHGGVSQRSQGQHNQHRQQQSSCQSTPCWIQNISSMIHEEREMNDDNSNNNKSSSFVLSKSKLKPLKFVAVKMNRKSCSTPWGLGFVLTMHDTNRKVYNNNNQCRNHNHRVIIVNNHNNNKHSINNNVEVSWVRAVQPYHYTINRNGFYCNYSNNDGNDDRTHFNSELYSDQLKRTMTTSQNTILDEDKNNGNNSNELGSKDDDGVSDLRPGDILVAIDGRSVFDYNNLTEMTTYLKPLQSVCFVVLRHPDVVATVNVCSQKNKSVNTKTNGIKKSDPMLRISSTANKLWNEILVPTRRTPLLSLESFLLPPIPTSSISSFQRWIKTRKALWRNRYNVYKYKYNIDNRISNKKEKRRLSCSIDDDDDDDDDDSYHRGIDFWKQQGFFSFDVWMSTRKNSWKRCYSWNKRKRKRIQNDCFERFVYLPWTNNDVSTTTPTTDMTTISHNHTERKYHCRRNNSLSSSNNDGNRRIDCTSDMFKQWLNIRRYQWRMLRRKRKKQNEQAACMIGDVRNTSTNKSCKSTIIPSSSLLNEATDNSYVESSTAEIQRNFLSASLPSSFGCSSSITGYRKDSNSRKSASPVCKRKLHFLLSTEDQETVLIDEILDEKEKQKKEIRRRRDQRPPLEIGRFFDISQGIPDDVIVHFFSYLKEREHGKMLVVNKGIAASLQDRYSVWKQLCPNHWILPRRPRKPWHTLYLTRLRQEQEQRQKLWDDLLLKCSTALFKRDDVQKVEKFVVKAEKEFGFDLNYSSGVVCERNSILNLAVIHKRHKVVRWLVDKKGADIETYDRGNFT